MYACAYIAPPSTRRNSVLIPYHGERPNTWRWTASHPKAECLTCGMPDPSVRECLASRSCFPSDIPRDVNCHLHPHRSLTPGCADDPSILQSGPVYGTIIDALVISDHSHAHANELLGQHRRRHTCPLHRSFTVFTAEVPNPKARIPTLLNPHIRETVSANPCPRILVRHPSQRAGTLPP